MTDRPANGPTDERPRCTREHAFDSENRAMLTGLPALPDTTAEAATNNHERVEAQTAGVEESVLELALASAAARFFSTIDTAMIEPS